ncbi:MAG: magnetosome biogenesis CDF transporter MamM [Gammaproteobacteria bacterium]|nr:magnetosome biogenesis CDF transporter MamM [Gammaproteobacteria bacterium]
MRYAKCVRCASVIGWVGLLANLLLLLLKAGVGVVAGSQALLADALYSAKDVISSLLVIVGLKVSRQPLDREHPYGHGKIEFILSMIISVVFLTFTAFLLVHALQLLSDGEMHQPPHLIAFWTALLSVAVNVYLYFYSRCVSVEVNSMMVRSLSQHHHADATSSLAVAFAIIAAYYFQMAWIDTAVALLLILHLMYLGGDVFWESYKGLMDRSAPVTVIDKVKKLTHDVDGVLDIGELRSRMVGQELWLDITIQVAADLTIDAADAIRDRIIERLTARIPHIGSVQVQFVSGALEHHDTASGESDIVFDAYTAPRDKPDAP